MLCIRHDYVKRVKTKAHANPFGHRLHSCSVYLTVVLDLMLSNYMDAAETAQPSKHTPSKQETPLVPFT